MSDKTAPIPRDIPRPLFVVEFADMTGEGWGKTARVLLRYFLENRGLGDLIGVESSGTRSAALDAFEAGTGDLKPAELIYSVTHGLNLNERLLGGAKFLPKDELDVAEDFVDLPSSRQFELLDPKYTAGTPSYRLRIAGISRLCLKKLRERERILQSRSLAWLAGDLDPDLLRIAAGIADQPRQTRVSPGRRLILTMTESDLTAVFSLSQDCRSVYDLKGRVIAREGEHHLLGKKYTGLAALLEPRKSQPVVVARLLYFVEGKSEYFRNPWEIDPEDHLPYSKRLYRLVRMVADGLQFGLREESVVALISGASATT